MCFLDCNIEFEKIQSDLIKADHIYVKLDVKPFHVNLNDNVVSYFRIKISRSPFPLDYKYIYRIWNLSWNTNNNKIYKIPEQ